MRCCKDCEDIPTVCDFCIFFRETKGPRGEYIKGFCKFKMVSTEIWHICDDYYCRIQYMEDW